MNHSALQSEMSLHSNCTFTTNMIARTLFPPHTHLYVSCCICKVNKHAHCSRKHNNLHPQACITPGMWCTRILSVHTLIKLGSVVARSLCCWWKGVRYSQLCHKRRVEGMERLKAGGELVWMCFWRLTVGGALALLCLMSNLTLKLLVIEWLWWTQRRSREP